MSNQTESFGVGFERPRIAGLNLIFAFFNFHFVFLFA